MSGPTRQTANALSQLVRKRRAWFFVCNTDPVETLVGSGLRRNDGEWVWFVRHAFLFSLQRKYFPRSSYRRRAVPTRPTAQAFSLFARKRYLQSIVLNTDPAETLVGPDLRRGDGVLGLGVRLVALTIAPIGQ